MNIPVRGTTLDRIGLDVGNRIYPDKIRRFLPVLMFPTSLCDLALFCALP